MFKYQSQILRRLHYQLQSENHHPLNKKFSEPCSRMNFEHISHYYQVTIEESPESSVVAGSYIRTMVLGNVGSSMKTFFVLLFLLFTGSLKKFMKYKQN